MEEFNAEFGHKLVWLPWQRPGFELGMMLRDDRLRNARLRRRRPRRPRPLHLGQYAARVLLNTITIIDQIGQFIERHAARPNYKRFGGASGSARDDRKQIAAKLMPHLRGAVSRQQRFHRHATRTRRRSSSSSTPRRLSSSRTSAPAAPITSSAPRFVRSSCAGTRPTIPRELPALFDSALETYRAEYADYYNEARAARLAQTARRQPHGRSDPRHRHVHLRQEQGRVPHHRRVLHQRHPRHAGRRRARRWQAICTAVPQASARIPSDQLHRSRQLRRASAQRSLPHRVLGARRSQDSPPAAGKGALAARSLSSSAEAAASAARSHCSPQSAART